MWVKTFGSYSMAVWSNFQVLANNDSQTIVFEQLAIRFYLQCIYLYLSDKYSS